MLLRGMQDPGPRGRSSDLSRGPEPAPVGSHACRCAGIAVYSLISLPVSLAPRCLIGEVGQRRGAVGRPTNLTAALLRISQRNGGKPGHFQVSPEGPEDPVLGEKAC
ncbi:Hypothetical predicted protein [Podarcis lilfordi]|uniref:Uncharacterized protein n=1 Tax=Podarcis lilfordi TaxID=74358 RepID=A0AA35K5K9_9SAUR|nr:Hypothetical predicted protein [Podarcis lilfordi]